MVKILHIHEDPKFLFDVRIYFSEDHINDILYIGQDEPLNFSSEGEYYNLPYCGRNKSQIKLLMNNKYSILVFWGMSKHQSQLLLEFEKKDTLIIWRFFGYEYYQRHMYDFVSPKTTQLLVGMRLNSLLAIKRRVEFLLQKLGLSFYNESLFNSCLAKVDFFQGLAKSEYDLIFSDKKIAPKFLQYPYVPKFDSDKNTSINLNRKRIILGVSKNIWCNHIDVIDTLKGVDCKIDVLFTYGAERDYSQAIRKSIDDRYTLITDHMKEEEYLDFYKSSLVLILNSYRQCGMGNVFTALRFGVKVYLNPKNVMFQWLRDEGFQIHSTTNLRKDIVNGILYDANEDMINRKAYDRLSETYSQEVFLRQLKEK